MGVAQVNRTLAARVVAERDHADLCGTIEERMKADFPQGSDTTVRWLAVDTVVPHPHVHGSPGVIYPPGPPIPLDEVHVDRNYTEDQLDAERRAVVLSEQANAQRGRYEFGRIAARIAHG